MAHVRIAHDASGQTYGAPRVYRELQAEGLPTSTKRVARLMREDGLVSRPRKRARVSTTNLNHDKPIAPNRLARQFDVNGIAINRIWVSDITHIPTREGPLYLATVLDLGSRRCVGWTMQDTMEVELVLSALRMAREARRPQLGLIHHSDRGSQDGFNRPSQHLTPEGLRCQSRIDGPCAPHARRCTRPDGRRLDGAKIGSAFGRPLRAGVTQRLP